MHLGPEAPAHPDHPRRAWVVVEQPRDEPLRLAYRPEDGTFRPDGKRSLLFARGFDGAYGWIVGFGEPPELHFDALVLTAARPRPGDVLEVAVSGLFRHAAGDHKIVTIDLRDPPRYGVSDLFALPEAVQTMIRGIYPRVDEGEGWFGADEARALLATGRPLHD